MRFPCRLCVWISMYSSYELLNAWTNLNETWYVYLVTNAHQNGVFHKSLLLVFVSVRVPFLSLLGNGSIKTLLRQRIHTQHQMNCCTRGFVRVVS
jgi:hypothetical protein